MDLRVGGKFKLIKKCGSGAFGEIYQGKSHTNQKQSLFLSAMPSMCINTIVLLIIGSNVKTNDDVAIKLVSTSFHL